MLVLSSFADDARALTPLFRRLELLLESHINSAWRDTLGSGEVFSNVPICHSEEIVEVFGIVHADVAFPGRAAFATIAASGGATDPRVVAGGARALPSLRGGGIHRCIVVAILVDSVAIYKGHGNRLHGFGLSSVSFQRQMSVARSAKFYF